MERLKDASGRSPCIKQTTHSVMKQHVEGLYTLPCAGVYAGLTEGEKEEKARAKEALHSDGEGSDDEGDTRKAATYGNKKNEVRMIAALASNPAPLPPCLQHNRTMMYSVQINAIPCKVHLSCIITVICHTQWALLHRCSMLAKAFCEFSIWWHREL